MTGRWAGLRFGLSSAGDIRNVAVSNITLHDIACSALKLQSTEGGALTDMTFSNIIARNIPRLVFATLNNAPITFGYSEARTKPGALEHMTFRDMSLTNAADLPYDANYGIIVLGSPNCNIDDLSFDGLRLALPGGGAMPAKPMPELNDARPEYFAFDALLPAAAVYFRHVRNSRIANARIALTKSDARSPIVLDDAEVELKSISVK